MITIKNDYHDTTITLRANIGDTLTPSRVRRIQRLLCGIDDCKCGGVAGERGRQDGFEIVAADYAGFAIIEPM